MDGTNKFVVVATIFFTLIVSKGPGKAGDDSVVNPISQSGSQTTGSIQGTVIYQSDSQRPWRLRRQYVKSRKKGHLAQAVVAITRLRRTQKPKREEQKTVNVDQRDFRFIPETLAIHVEDQVRFLNSDAANHNIQSHHSRQSFNITLPAGAEHTQTFTAATGIRQPHRIGCVFHSEMRAWIFVFDHPFFDVTDVDGTFRLDNVPPGEYKIEMTHPAGELSHRKTVKVTAGKTINFDIQVSPDHKKNR